MMRRLLALLVVAFAALVVAAPAAAKPSKKDIVLAKKSAQQAKKHEKKGDWEEAREAWQKSVDLNDTADGRVGLARAESELGHLLLAEEHLNKALEHKKISWGARRKAKKLLGQLEKRIPTLQVELPADFAGKVLVDGEERDPASLTEPLRVDPGEHTVQAEAEGFKPFSESIVLEEGDKKNLTVLLTEQPKSDPKPLAAQEDKADKGSSTQKTLGWVSLAVGGVGLAVGTVMGLQARSTRDELDDKCRDNRCTEAERDLYDEGKSQADIATAGFIVGGVGIGLGAFLLLTADSESPAPEPAADEARIEPVIGPAYLGARGTF